VIPATLASYEVFVYSLRDAFPVILASTLRVIRSGPAAGQIVGTLAFAGEVRLEVAEQVDFDAGCFEILQYGYTVWQGNERLYWYDSQSHPNDPSLASTDPHHKHVPPDIKHHRIPAPRLSFAHPNLPVLIEEIQSR
jgi:hypothetical protein